MYVLDTNVVSTFLDRRRTSPQLSQRILSEPPEHLFTTAITVEEVLKGALAFINQSRQRSTVTAAYDNLLFLFESLHQFQVLPYTEEAEAVFKTLSPQIKRVGTRDCRIAAIAHLLSYTVVTMNVSDFLRIGLVEVEDWSVPTGRAGDS